MPRQRREIPWLHVLDGTYYVYWYDKAGKRTKRISLQTKDVVEAQKRYADFLANGQEVFDESRVKTGLTVTHALDDYWRDHVQPNVIDKARQEDATRHLKEWFKTTLLTDIDIPSCRAYADARRTGLVGGGMYRKSKVGSDSTIRRELGVLQAAANHARKWKRITLAEVPVVERPAEGREEAQWLTLDELTKAVNTADGVLKDFIMLAYYTAGRRSSIERLTRFQVDLKNNRINLTSPHESAAERRSKKRRPVVPIDSNVRPVVERLVFANLNSEWLFGTPRNMYHAFRAHMRAIGLAGKANPHILRHSRATHLLQAGKSLWDVAKLLGDTVATVERVYGHHCADHLADVISEGEA
jgi:integrase